MKPLNLFYQNPDPDRWIKFDRYPRRVLRKIIRGTPKPSGQEMVAINLMKGLDKLNIPYRFNDFKYIKQQPEELACIIGKPQLLFERKWPNPVIFGASVYSHPLDHPDLFDKYPNVKRMLVPGPWMQEMFKPWYGDKITSWPVGIDTETWKPQQKKITHNVLIYDKIRWEHERYEELLLTPILNFLEQNNLTYDYIKYGDYEPHELKQKVNACESVIFLCEHETQGLAYQQILATGTPIFAWDRGGYWQDPAYYPDKVKYRPVSSVPYWDDRCGLKFKNIDEFKLQLDKFLNKLDDFEPREYIMENLTLEKCAAKYLSIVQEVEKEING